MKTIFVSAITAALVVISLLTFNAYAGRSAGGTYTLASPGVPFQSGQVISSTQMNNTFNDIATTLTNSLDRNGNGGMLAALRGIDGTNAAPAFSFTSETNTGLYRVGTGDLGVTISGTKVADFTSGGLLLTIPGSATSVPFTAFEAGLTNGNIIALEIGKSAAANASGQVAFIPNATAANSTACLGITGVSSQILCVDGNSKTSLAGTLAVTGASTLTGAAALNGGVTIGSSGTSISNSIRGTLVVGGGAILAQACAAQVVTVTGAVAGAECAIGYPNLNPSGLVSYCQVAANSCQVITCNATSGSLTAVANTLSCRVFNP